MNLLFYRASYGTWLDKAIALWTRGPYSHVELQFCDGACFSSSPRDGGVRFKQIDVVPERWLIAPILLDAPREAALKSWCMGKLGLRYDWLGVFGLAIGAPHLEDERRWYCSEICATGLRKVEAWPFEIDVTPNEMEKEWEKLAEASRKGKS